jgi:hypothetical protein
MEWEQMKFCQPHWDAMREAVKKRGLWKFVAEGREAFDNTVLALKGHGEPFDPLMGSMWKIAGQVGQNVERSQGPLAALQCMGDPNWCPLCQIQESFENLMDGGKAAREEFMRNAPKGSKPLDAQGWIDATMDGALEYAREQKMPIGEAT